ncbi:MAG TPA: cytochrome P450 [Polyangia bacterium]|nr:cytochrome P450 [Polyangia bacterium]
MTTPPLPPGDTGLPFLGEVNKFLADGFAFVEDRVRKHGPVFKTRILGRDTAVIVGPDAAGQFIDQTKIQRSGAMLPHVQALFGGNALPVLDGDEHRERKSFVMAAFTREALAAYLPEMQRQVGEAVARWAAQPEVRWLDELKRLALEVICTTILGLQPGPALDQIARDYEIFGKGFSALPIALPGTTYKKATQALDRILAAYEKNVKEHLAAPGGSMDGLTRILESRSPRDGRAIGVDAAKRELHHIVVAGLIVWAWFVTAVVELERNPAVRDRLRAEVATLPAGRLTPSAFAAAPYLSQVAMEIRRISPVVHVFFGKARETFTFAGHEIPRGWMVLFGIRSSHLRPEIYADPEKFDPERFAAPRSEQDRHPHAFVPNGAGDPHTGHKCAGYEYAPLLLNVFLVELLRSGVTWTFSEGQDLSLDYSRIPPAPRDGLRARITR